MKSIELLVEEHKYIKRMLLIVRQYCYKILKGEPIQYEDFFEIIDFVRNYADKHHHGKEETILFDTMIEELGETADKLITHGMLVEHAFGRLYIQELEIAVKAVLDGKDEARLDVIANAISYTHLLSRHIDKEDSMVYKYGENNMSDTALKNIDQQFELFEKTAKNNAVQQKYLNLIDELEAKLSKH